MKEHPILFSTPMVKAILEGRKTMTRRIIKPQPVIDEDSGFVFDGKYRVHFGLHNNWQQRFIDDFSKWVPEDWLWARESSFPSYKGDKYFYKADYKDGYKPDHKWKPSIHMPKVAARIWLKVTNIKVERVRSISQEDILKEGIRYPVNEGHPIFKIGEENTALRFMPEGFKLDGSGTKITESDLLYAHWAELWCKVNGRESWDADDWVWVIEFRILSTTGKPQYKKLSDVQGV